MIYPTLASLLERVDSKYTLVVAVSKRARQLVDGQPRLTKVDSNKPVTIAINEISEGKILYERNKQEKLERTLESVEMMDLVESVDRSESADQDNNR
jgi:DNA-directed RNA polymerase subunit omega